MNALGASELERTICATAGIAGTVATHGVSPEVDPEEWPHARYLLVWGWNPMSTAPHLWRKLLEARSAGARLVVVDPFRSRTARRGRRAPAPAAGHRRRAGHRDDARDRGRRPRTTRSGAARTPTATTSCSRGSAEHPVERLRRDLRRATPRRSPASGASSPPPGPRCCGSAWAPSATPGAPAAYSHGRLAARAHRRLAGPRRRLLLHPDRHRRRAVERAPARAARTCARAGPRRSTCRGSARRSPTRRWTRRSRRSSCWNSNPASIAPDQERVLEGLRRDDLFTVVLEQFMTDTARHADVVLPGHHPARAPRRGLLLGPPLRDLERAGDRAARRGEAEHGDLPPARRAARPRRSVLPRQRRGAAWSSCSPAFEENGLRERGWTKVDLGQGPTPARRGRLRHRAERPRRAARALRAARRGRRRGARRALPARAGHAQDAPVPQLDLRQPAAPALGAAGAGGGGAAPTTPRRAASRTARACASSTTAARSAARRACRTTPAPACSWRRWAGGTRDYQDGRSGQATTSQLLTPRATRPPSTTTASSSKGSDPSSVLNSVRV